MPETTQKFSAWAVLELFGHQRIAGYVTEETIGGAALIRVDVPETGKPGYTKYFGNGAIYAITPCSEEAARFNAGHIERYTRPLPYEPPKQIAPSSPVEIFSDDDVADFRAGAEEVDDEDIEEAVPDHDKVGPDGWPEGVR